MIPILSKRHNLCRAKSYGADYYLTPTLSNAPTWACYGTTAAQVRKLMGHSSDLHQCVNWQDDEMEKAFYQLTVPEKHVRAFVAKLSTHGSVALVEPSGQLGGDRETLFECIAVVPKLGGAATPDDDDLL
jgi:hypothetical protein